MQYAWIYARSELPKSTKDYVKQRRGPSTRSQGILTYILPSRHFRNARCNFVQCPHLEALSLKCETEWEDALKGKHPKQKIFWKMLLWFKGKHPKLKIFIFFTLSCKLKLKHTVFENREKPWNQSC